MMLREGRCIAVGPKDEVLDKVTQRSPATATKATKTGRGFKSTGMQMIRKPR